VAVRRNRRPIDICLLDLAAMLLESERAAKTIEYRLALVHRGVLTPLAPEHQTAEQIITTSLSLVDEARKLVQNATACRALLNKLQGEFNWFLRT
jgi:hypothetical protein